jgi:hypothetical protein
MIRLLSSYHNFYTLIYNGQLHKNHDIKSTLDRERYERRRDL